MKKVALITGSGSKRLGKVIANELAETGYDLALHYLTNRDSANENKISAKQTDSLPILK